MAERVDGRIVPIQDINQFLDNRDFNGLKARLAEQSKAASTSVDVMPLEVVVERRKDPESFINEQPSPEEFHALAARKGVGVLLEKVPGRKVIVENPIAVSIRRQDPQAAVPDYTVLDFVTGDTLVLKPI